MSCFMKGLASILMGRITYMYQYWSQVELSCFEMNTLIIDYEFMTLSYQTSSTSRSTTLSWRLNSFSQVRFNLVVAILSLHNLPLHHFAQKG